MRTVICLAIGFWVSRQLYLKYDKEKTKKAQQRLTEFLRDNGWTKREAKLKVNELWRV